MRSCSDSLVRVHVTSVMTCMVGVELSFLLANKIDASNSERREERSKRLRGRECVQRLTGICLRNFPDLGLVFFFFLVHVAYIDFLLYSVYKEKSSQLGLESSIARRLELSTIY